MDKLVFIIGGSKTKNFGFLNPVLKKFYKYFGVEEGEDSWRFELRDYLIGKADVKIFDWGGGITETFSINKSAQKLSEQISESGHEEIVLFGKSLGGYVAEKAIDYLSCKNKKIKLIYVATPHKKPRRDFGAHIEAINIYSFQDKYQRLGNFFLYFGKGKQEMENAKNINLPHLQHKDFNKNKWVIVKNKRVRLFDFYKKLIMR